MAIFTNVLKKYIDLGLFVPPLVYRIVGYDLIVRKHFDKAETIFEILQNKYPNRIDGYEGLISIAQKTDRWDMVVIILDVAIEKFPDHLKFVSQQINALTKIGAIHKVSKLVEKSKLRFPDMPLLAMAEAKYFRDQFDYQRAQTILDTVAEKKSDHLELRIMQANNYWELGNHQKAMEILQLVRPRLDFSRRTLPYQFTFPYIHILLANNELQELQRFFEEALSNKIRNSEILLGYSQILVSQKKYDEAATFIESLIKDKALNLELNHYALLVFESVKIKNIQNIQSFDLSKIGTLPQSSGTKSFYTFLNQIKLQLKEHPDFQRCEGILMEPLEMLDQLSTKYPSYLNTAVSPFETYEVALHIIFQIKKKKPLSFIRLGDGEGHFLPYEKDLQQFQEQDRISSQNIWWGIEKIDDTTWQKLEADYLSAIQNADILGIPGPWRCCRTFLRIQNANTKLNNDARGLKAIIALLHNDQKEIYREVLPILTSCHIHSHFEDLGLWDMILNEIENCSVISCHPEIVRVLKEKYEITVQNYYGIPSQHKYSMLFNKKENVEAPHFPDRFYAICSDISVSYPGEVFLVAAGFFGKFYCNIIKQKGGIALDVGSTADYWLNYKTRVWTKYPNPISYKIPI